VLWDLGGAAPLRSIWDKYFGEAHALMCVLPVFALLFVLLSAAICAALSCLLCACRSYVVDATAAERLEESRAALERVRAQRRGGWLCGVALPLTDQCALRACSCLCSNSGAEFARAGGRAAAAAGQQAGPRRRALE